MCVLGIDTVVVEGWSSCFIVGLVLVSGQGCNFGELVLAPVGLSGDFGLRLKMCVCYRRDILINALPFIGRKNMLPSSHKAS